MTFGAFLIPVKWADVHLAGNFPFSSPDRGDFFIFMTTINHIGWFVVSPPWLGIFFMIFAEFSPGAGVS